MKNILLVKGNGIYGAQRNYIDEFERGFWAFGYDTIVLDVMAMGFEKKYRWILEHYPIYAVMDCQGLLLEFLSDDAYKEDVLHVHYLCDHPLYHALRLERMKSNSIIINVDEKHTEYLRRYYPKFVNTAFVPLGGAGTNDQKPYREREIEVLFTGSYWVPEMPVSEVEDAGFVQEVRRKVLYWMLKHPMDSIEDVLEKILGEYEISVEAEEFAGILSEFGYIESYVRQYNRDRVIRILLKAGIHVGVYGNGWENLLCVGRENLTVFSGGKEVAKRALGNTKIALNIMPGFKAGFQERIADAMLNGAVSVTDTSRYIENQFKDGENLVVYQLDKLEELPQKIFDLLENEEWATQIAAEGRRLAAEKHTWKQRVQNIAALIERAHGRTFHPSGRMGKRMEIAVEEEEMHYRIEEIALGLSEKLNLFNELNSCGYINQTDLTVFLDELQTYNQALKRQGVDGFMEEENLHIFSDQIKSQITRSENIEDSILMVLLMADSFLNMMKNQLRAVRLEYILIHGTIGENKSLYNEMLVKFLLAKYRDSTEKQIQQWVESMRHTGHAQSYPMQLTEKHTAASAEVQYDEQRDMLYVVHHGKRMYYPREYSVQEVCAAYQYCCIEQDVESPHRYLDEQFLIEPGSVVLDAGAAEGNFALDIVEHAEKVYLVECEEKWIEALQATFLPYKEKTVIIPKMLGNQVDDKWTTVDEIAGEDRIDFIKMDVEGCEADALLGAENTFRRNRNMKCVIATYHVAGMGERVKRFLEEHHFSVDYTPGYILYKNYEMPVWEHELRHALVRAERMKGSDDVR